MQPLDRRNTSSAPRGGESTSERPRVDSTLKPLDLLIVGAGFAGLYMLHLARQQGLTALAIDAAPSVGGTWYANRYPGARVDIQSLEYSFGFDEALQQQWHWSERYAGQPELLRYANHVADRFKLRDGIELSARMVGAEFDEAAALWQVSGDADRRWTARFVVMATGPLSAPNRPSFAGLDSFNGPVHHTADWPLTPVDFSGQRVGVIGTGSSGIQLIPLVAQQAEHLTVFQRTPAYAVPAHNGPLDAAYEARTKADYAGFRARNRAMRTGFGSDLPPGPGSALDASDAEREANFEARWRIGGFSLLAAYADLMVNAQANALVAEFVRRKIRATVHDPATAQLLCPQHTIGCKRLCVDSGYYETFNRPNVRLVDIAGAPVQAITPTGLTLSDGQRHRFDTLVLATGFDAITGTLLRMDIRGRGGLPLREHWAAGPRNHLGLMAAGFPNLFVIGGPGCPAAFVNNTVSIEQQVQWIAGCLSDLVKAGRHSIEPTPESEAQWLAKVNSAAQATLFMTCNSWYLGANVPGKPRQFMPLVGGFPAYSALCNEVAQQGYPGFVLT